MLMTKRLGASGGVALRQLLIKSVRNRTNNTKASKPQANALICTTANAGRADICRVANTNQCGARWSLTLLRNNCSASQLNPANSSTAAKKPPTTIKPNLMSLLAANSKAEKPSTPKPKTNMEAGFKLPTSRRITRSGGTCASCNTGGKPKAKSSVMPTPKPNSTGQMDAAGKLLSTKPASNHTNT